MRFHETPKLAQFEKNNFLGKLSQTAIFLQISFQLILKCQLGKKEQYVLCQTAIDRVEQKK